MQNPLFRNPHLEGDSFFWQGGATGVLLIHGFTATTAEVRLLGEFLRARNYTVSAPLLPGHGTTPDEANKCKWQDWTNAVAQAYQELQTRCERVFVCGESMGALLALYLASEHAAIAGVALYAPALLIPQTRLFTARLFGLFVPYLAKPDPVPSAANDRWKGYAVNPLHATIQLGELQNVVRQRLARIQQPLLLVQGRLDQTIDPRSGTVILNESAATDKHLLWFEKSTHCIILDQEWERVAQATLEFIQRLASEK